MIRKSQSSSASGVELMNLQKRYSINSVSLLAFARDVRRQLRLGKKQFNVCLVDDNAIRKLNADHRGKDKATDVLSFRWDDPEPPGKSRPALNGSSRVGITNFLGDIVISVETAGANAEDEGHSTLSEIRWLILHGVLHLLGYDHERDNGEMVALELQLRDRLGVSGHKKQAGSGRSRPKQPKSKR
jgi:probable rRNA maturation factor